MNLMSMTTFTLLRNPALRFAFILALGLISQAVHAIAYYQNQVSKHGAVMARAMALDENGQPILVEYNADGSEAGVVGLGEYADQVFSLSIISAYEYHAEALRLEEFRNRANNPLAEDAELMSATQFEGATFQTAGGETMSKPRLPRHVNSVLVRGRSNRLINDPNQLVLLSFTIDFTESANANVPDTGSVVLTENGQVVTSSPLNIAPRVGFHGDPNESQDLYGGYIRKPDEQIFGPVPGVKVYVEEMVYPGGVDVTGSDGKYRLNFRLPPCPGFSFEYPTDVWAELRYANFSPNGAPSLPYYLRRQDWSWCHGVALRGASIGDAMGYVNAVATLATMATPNYTIDLRVDVMFLTGRVLIQNPDGSTVPIGAQTEYAVREPSTTPQPQTFYDFDGDGVRDTSYVGKMESRPQPDGSMLEEFVRDNAGDLQGVYFSSRIASTGIDGPPDVIRQADTRKEFEPTGLLSSISEDDFKNTDILVFRESTGQLVVERRGLRDAEIDGRAQVGLGEDGDNVFYRIMLRGPRDTHLNIGGTNRSGSWTDWTTRNQLTESFRNKESDQLKPGEMIRMVVINRATGYMGTQRIRLSDASQTGGFLNVPVEDLVMRPPNLKIWAERSYDVEHGLSANGEDRRFLIGAEGAGLVGDTMIEVFSEWYDEEGRPLPDELGKDSGEQYGLSGRLAKVVGVDQIQAAAGGDTAIFPIAPGRQTQLLKIRDNLAVAEHFYIHVTGTQKDESPQFGEAGAAVEEPMNTRPRTLTPFLTPLYDENKDWQTYNAYRDLLREQGGAENPDPDATTPLKPLPSYVWSYRPEYQFSQYELEVEAINRTSSAGDTTNVLEDPQALIGELDQLLTMLYSLITNRSPRLTPIDGPEELVFAIGEEEIKLTLDKNQQVQFDNLEHLARLTPEDFLSIRLYSNQDAGNILWEYAFATEGERDFPRHYSLAMFNDEPALVHSIFDSYQIFSVPLETESAVQVNLLDQDRQPSSTLISRKVLPAGTQHFVVLRADLEKFLPRPGTDLYIVVKTIPTNGASPREKSYKVDLQNHISGEMLGQIVQHDTLIQRGSLTLRREDMVLSGAGPQLDFVRSYSNESKPENTDAVLSPGWSHNHNIFVQVLGYGDDQPPYDNNLPGWIGATRESLGEPKFLDSQTLYNLRNRAVSPSMVAVSNGGNFKRNINSWIAQRGNHGSLTHLADGGWEYRSKDGSVYTFEPNIPGYSKAFVKTITDRNGNTLTYDYITLNGERLLLSVVDAVGRKLDFSYSLADNSRMRLNKVTSSVGNELMFDYYPKAASGYDPRVGMLRSFTRETFTETYDYAPLSADPQINLSSVADANGQVTRYEYHPADDVPLALATYAPGLNRYDVVHKVFYPATSGTAVAEIKYPVTLEDNIREVIDLRGNPTTYILNALGNPTRINEPEGRNTTFEWSADMGEPDNLLRKKTDLSIGANWEYEYDAKGNLTKEVDPYGKVTEQSWSPLFSVLLYRQDKNNNVFQQELDAKGNVLVERQTGTVDGAITAIETKHTYGDVGKAKGLRRTTTNGRGFRTEFNYDQYGLISSVKGPEGSTTTYENNSRGLRLSETDGSDNRTTYEYDELDRVTLTTDAEGNTTTYQYDNKGNKKVEEVRDSYLVDTTKHNRYTKLAYTYDARDRVTRVERSGNLDGQYAIAGNKTYAYDGNSNLLQESDWKGASSNYTYDALNRRLTAKNRNDDSMAYAYAFLTGDDAGLKTTITDFEGRVTQEFADKLGRKVRVVHPTVTNIDDTVATHERHFTYDNLENLLAVRDENDQVTRFTYDGRNLKLSQTNADSKTYTWHYDATDNVSKTIDEALREISYVYDRQNRLTQKQTPENQTWTYSYNANGTLLSETDPWKFSYSYTYNKINQRTSVSHPDGVETESYTQDGQLVFKRDAEGRSISHLYGPDNRLQVAMDARGRTTTYSYDDNNNVTETHVAWAEALTGPASVTTQSEYDAEDRLITSTRAAGSSVAQVTAMTYDKVGNVITQTGEDNQVTRFEYDERNRAKRIETAAVDGLNPYTLQLWDGVGNKITVTDRRGNSTTTAYDVLNRPLTVTDADSNSITYTYDAVNNLLTETNRRGHTTEHVYDDLNRLTERFVNDNAGTRFRLLKNEYDLDGKKSNAVTDAMGNRVVSTMDWRGNNLVTTLPAGADYAQSTLVNEYDQSGFLIRATDAADKVTIYTYYADGSVASIINPSEETTAFTYDLFGNKASITKPNGKIQTLAYDEQNRLVSVTDALSNQTRFEYDRNNNLLAQYLPAANDSGSTLVEYTYDALNRKRSHIQRKGDGDLVTAYVYDAEGNLTQTTDAKGQVFTQVYDALNRLTEQNFPADSDVTRIVSGYDANGNVDTITETKASGTEVTSHTYDLLDRLTEQNQRGRVIGYAYDNNGNRTSVTSLGGASTYAYDSRNRLSTVTAGTTSRYRYFANGWLEQVEQGNGTTASYTYDDTGRVSTITNTLANGNILSSFAYAYDENGNRTQQVETQNGFLTVKVLTTDYVYDDLDRLESYTETDTGGSNSVTTHGFTYYPSYDRKTETVERDGNTLKNRSYQYDETYWLTGITETAGTGGTIAYQYDPNGNTTRKTDTTGGSSQSTLFDYNSRNQLKQVATGTPGAEIGQGSHDYNYAGMRIRHLNSERGDIEYLYDGNSIIDEVQNNSTNLVAHYRYGDRLLSLNTTSGDQFYHYASLGTTANLTNAQGEQQVAYRTDPFGTITQQEGESVNRQVFTGQEHDEKTGLIYFGARFYDPDTARFINQDTYLGESTTPPSLHRYLYAYANPTVYLDHNGNFPVTEQVSAWLNQRADDNMNALRNVQKDHGSTLGTRSLAAVSGIGGALFKAAGGIVGLVDMGLDANAANLRSIPGAESLSVIKDAGEKTDRRKEAIATFATSAKDYIRQEDLGAALTRDSARGLDATSTYLGDVFVRGNLDATASWSGAMAEIASGGVLSRSAKLSKLDIQPTVTGEAPNINRGAQNTPPARNSATPDGCPCCFAGGTPVLTKDGLKPIETIQEGELVASRDEETGEVEWKTVTALFVNDDDRLTYALILVNEQGQQERYEVTDNHPFNVEGAGWVDAINLEAGMKIPSYQGGYLTVVSLSALNRSPVTYNFEVKDFHTYFVGEQGAWVHNQCSCGMNGGASADTIKEVPKLNSDTRFYVKQDGTTLDANTYNRNSSFRSGVRDTTWNDAVEVSTNRVRDPLTGRFMSQDSPWDMGHRPRMEYRKERKNAINQWLFNDEFMDRSDFLDKLNDPSRYRPELPSSNRGHKAEDLTDDFWE